MASPGNTISASGRIGSSFEVQMILTLSAAFGLFGVSCRDFRVAKYRNKRLTKVISNLHSSV